MPPGPVSSPGLFVTTPDDDTVGPRFLHRLQLQLPEIVVNVDLAHITAFVVARPDEGIDRLSASDALSFGDVRLGVLHPTSAVVVEGVKGRIERTLLSDERGKEVIGTLPLHEGRTGCSGILGGPVLAIGARGVVSDFGVLRGLVLKPSDDLYELVHGIRCDRVRRIVRVPVPEFDIQLDRFISRMTGIDKPPRGRPDRGLVRLRILIERKEIGFIKDLVLLQSESRQIWLIDEQQPVIDGERTC